MAENSSIKCLSPHVKYFLYHKDFLMMDDFLFLQPNLRGTQQLRIIFLLSNNVYLLALANFSSLYFSASAGFLTCASSSLTTDDFSAPAAESARYTVIKDHFLAIQQCIPVSLGQFFQPILLSLRQFSDLCLEFSHDGWFPAPAAESARYTVIKNHFSAIHQYMPVSLGQFLQPILLSLGRFSDLCLKFSLMKHDFLLLGLNLPGTQWCCYPTIHTC